MRLNNERIACETFRRQLYGHSSDDATRSAAPEEKPKRHEGGMSERVTENATGKCDWKHVQGASRNASEWDELQTENC